MVDKDFMDDIDLFIEKININQIWHLKNIAIPISNKERKHLILTGKNGTGKTSSLLAIKEKLKILLNKHSKYIELTNLKDNLEKELLELEKKRREEKERGQKVSIIHFVKPHSIRKEIGNINDQLLALNKVDIAFADKLSMVLEFCYEQGFFILASFDARRNTKLNVPQGIQKIKFKNTYSFEEKLSSNFLQHIVNLKADRSFAKDDNDTQVIKGIDIWFGKFEEILRLLFNDEKLKLTFKRMDYNFDIILSNGQTMPFNALSDGYSAILNIVMELMLRMEGKVKNVYDIQGIVLIDEVETHLHIDLQKKILPFLTSFFPKIQFIVSTHSPFVISSLSNAVVYDLEKRIRFEDLSEYPIDGIVEGYFDNDKYSAVVTKKIQEYEALTEKDILTEQEEKRRYELFKDLSDVSGKLAPELKMKFQQIQLKRLAKTNG